MSRKLFTSESVTEGHPDKMCDQISDAILDAMLTNDPQTRAGIEALTKTGFVVVAGEVTTRTYVDIQKVVRDTIRGIGYDKHEYGFEADACGVLVALSEQSPDIAVGVNETETKEQGAGDQGMMFGYATDETPEFMPLPIIMAHKMAQQLANVRKNGTLPYLRPDGKTQITVEYIDGAPARIDAVVVSAQHAPEVQLAQIREDIIREVIRPIAGEWLDASTRFFVNPTGVFVMGGPVADAGLTGRKIIVDTYGGHGAHGGGCFSGKDPSKVDRSACYMARYVAKNLVAAGLAKKCEVQIAYAIGVAEPVSILVDTFGTGVIDDAAMETLIREHFELTPRGIIESLDLRRPIYKKTAAYGHFGRLEPEFSWERTDKVDALKAAVEAKARLAV